MGNGVVCTNAIDGSHSGFRVQLSQTLEHVGHALAPSFRGQSILVWGGGSLDDLSHLMSHGSRDQTSDYVARNKASHTSVWLGVSRPARCMSITSGGTLACANREHNSENNSTLWRYAEAVSDVPLSFLTVHLRHLSKITANCPCPT